jgi:hypothetical protein
MCDLRGCAVTTGKLRSPGSEYAHTNSPSVHVAVSIFTSLRKWRIRQSPGICVRIPLSLPEYSGPIFIFISRLAPAARLSCRDRGEGAFRLKREAAGLYEAVTWVGIASVTGITSDVHDRQYHYSRTLSGPVSVLSYSYIPGTTMCI